MDSGFLNKPSSNDGNGRSDGNGSKSRPLILCVDDEANALYTRYKVLDSAGYSVVSATNGTEALTMFVRDIVDLVLLDFQLEGMHGGLVAEAMKAAAPEVPIVIVSGAEVPEHYIAMCDGYISKADGPEALLSTIRELLSSGLTTRR